MNASNIAASHEAVRTQQRHRDPQEEEQQQEKELHESSIV